MIEKFEKEEDDVEGKKYTEVKKKDATHKHICYHDEFNPKPCRRVKIK